MKSTRLIFVLLIGMNALHALGQPATKPDEKTIAYLKKFRTDYITSMRLGKTDRLQIYYAETVRIMPAFQKTMMGKANTTSYYKAFANRFTVHDFFRNELEILDLGNQLLEIGTFTAHVTAKSTGKEHALAGKYLSLWEEVKNGEPLLITEAWNYDQYYGDLHEQLKFEEVPSAHMALQPNVVINSNISFELAALNRLLDATVTQHDANTWKHYYADDAMLLANYHPICQGKEAIDEYIKMHVKELPIFEELDIRNDRIDDLGIFVIEYASHIASWKNGDGSGVSLGKNIRIWKRESNHSLKLFRSIGMYD